VRPLDGRVRVLDLAGRELADVPVGASWSAPAPAVAPEPAPAPVVAPSPRPAAPAHAAAIVVAALVTRARSALAAGDAARARGLLDRALSAAPAPAERAAIELLSADALLVARRPDEAIAAYRAVLRRHPRAPEGETAAFAVGQLLLERGADAEAGAALNDYVAQYPHGRFVREARERLAQIRAQ
jgi:tetratricopeptide (TPR) repeat protein